MEVTRQYQTVLVTGANGFYAAAIMDRLVKDGITIHGTVRSQRAVEALETKYGKQIKIFIVPDICAENAFHDAVKGVDAVFHVASPFIDTFSNARAEFLDPAMKGALSALEAAATEPKVKRVVMTSSCAAIVNPLHSSGFHRPGYTYTEADWNPLTYEEASERTDFDPVYTASKKLAEEAAWNFMKESKRHFDLVCINPCHTWGFYTQPVSSASQLNKTNAELARLIDGEEKDLPYCHMPWAVRIENVVDAHIQALYNPKANGRYIIANQPLDFQQIVDIMVKRFPEADWLENVPKGKPGTRQLTEFFSLDNSRSIRDLGLNYGPVEQCIVDFCTQYQVDRKKWASKTA
ncbi:related to flavonol reductase/cinnamoyl-CoA reductase [Phialocephala subalpina]|uniref:Related to flavonol reductase/cinnamoyl-CoA reductase n=1 Tax=Phialocephala subalpina TaxID=576137 RepID=A0A1L7XJ87_9HELO|nr:related to flavonol reductase/cinnamoyl-CoA reductase [Phialocephala subalpina]